MSRKRGTIWEASAELCEPRSRWLAVRGAMRLTSPAHRRGPHAKPLQCALPGVVPANTRLLRIRLGFASGYAVLAPNQAARRSAPSPRRWLAANDRGTQKEV